MPKLLVVCQKGSLRVRGQESFLQKLHTQCLHHTFPGLTRFGDHVEHVVDLVEDKERHAQAAAVQEADGKPYGDMESREHLEARMPLRIICLWYLTTVLIAIGENARMANVITLTVYQTNQRSNN